MDWLRRLNEAITYIEDNLDGTIDYAQAAQKACCSAYHFQRMFSYMAEVPLSEYIRNRRLSRAAVDLQNGGDKVIDVAVRIHPRLPGVPWRVPHRRPGKGRDAQSLSGDRLSSTNQRSERYGLQTRGQRSLPHCGV